MNNHSSDQSPDIKIETQGFVVNLGTAAHQQAEQLLAQHQQHPDLAKRVYLNALAVHAVNVYLNRCLNFETDLSQSDSQDAVMQALADVSDLHLHDRGRVECRVVLPGETAVRVPMEVWDDRVAYVAVQLNRELTEAHLVGFLPQVAVEDVPLTAWQPLDDLLVHLAAAQESAQKLEQKPQQQSITHLSHWLQGQAESVWQSLDHLLNSPQLAFNFRRGRPQAHDRDGDAPGEGWTKHAKVLNLKNCPEPLALLVGMKPLNDQIQDEYAIWLQVRPIDHQAHLPNKLSATLLNRNGEEAGTLKVTGHDEALQFKFEGTVGDQFSLRINFDPDQITESFQV